MLTVQEVGRLQDLIREKYGIEIQDTAIRVLQEKLTIMARQIQKEEIRLKRMEERRPTT